MKNASLCPTDFVPQFVTSNGVHYPCHTEDASHQSQYNLVLRDCFRCGGGYSFAEYFTKNIVLKGNQFYNHKTNGWKCSIEKKVKNFGISLGSTWHNTAVKLP